MDESASSDDRNRVPFMRAERQSVPKIARTTCRSEDCARLGARWSLRLFGRVRPHTYRAMRTKFARSADQLRRNRDDDQESAVAGGPRLGELLVALGASLKNNSQSHGATEDDWPQAWRGDYQGRLR